MNNSLRKYITIKKSPKHWAFFCCLILLISSFVLQQISPNFQLDWVLSRNDYFFQFQIFTYSFFHINGLHFFTNIGIFIILYLFVQTYFENTYIWIIFIIGIVLGALGFIWIPNTNNNTYLMGISSGNLGWLIVMIVNFPKSEIKIAKTPFKLKYIMIFLIIFHISSLILDQTNSWQAHLGSIFLLPLLYFYNKIEIK